MPYGSALLSGRREKVIHVDAGLFSFRLPLPSVVLKIADPFLFLAIDRDDGSAFLFKLLASAVDMAKLCIAIHMPLAFDGLFVDMQREALRVQHLSQSRFLDTMSFGCQSSDQVSQRLACPAEPGSWDPL